MTDNTARISGPSAFDPRPPAITGEHAQNMPKIGGHAVVLGASMGGLLAARVLADFYETVTVVERDVLADDAVNRRGVPQGRHVHALLGRGSQVLADLFPVLRLVIVVMTAETAGGIDVADVVGVGPKSNVHVRKHVPTIDVLNGKDRATWRRPAARSGKSPAARARFPRLPHSARGTPS